MSAWTVVVWAVVTPDLEDALRADLAEAAAALGPKRSEPDIHVHVNIVRPRTDGSVATELWSTPDADPGDAHTKANLHDLLVDASCWNDDRQRLLVLWGHGAIAFPSRGLSAGVPVAADVVSNLDGLPKPDIIGYDACQMATVATVSSLAAAFPHAMFIGSMVPEPIKGWPYMELVQILRDPSLTPAAVSIAIVQAYAASLAVQHWAMVALRLDFVCGGDPDLPEELGLTDALDHLISTAEPPERIRFFSAADGADILEDTNLVDLGALMRGLRVDEMQPSTADAQLAVDRAIHSATVAWRAAGELTGRDGVAVRLGVPWGPGASTDPAWPEPPAAPGWADYLPGVRVSSR
jgi:hypothetical protein